MLALEKPHCGVSGVPFMNNTTGADPTALSIAALVSVDRRRAACKGERRICLGVKRRKDGEEAGRMALGARRKD